MKTNKINVVLSLNKTEEDRINGSGRGDIRAQGVTSAESVTYGLFYDAAINQDYFWKTDTYYDTANGFGSGLKKYR